MKKLFGLIMLVGALHSSHAQSTMHLVNDSNCDLLFVMFLADTGTCGFTTDTNFVVLANSSTVINAPAGQEYFHAEVTSFPGCWGGVGFDISTPQNCYSSCPGWVSFWYTGTNSGCNGCLPNIRARWSDCYAPGEGLLVVNDY